MLTWIHKKVFQLMTQQMEFQLKKVINTLLRCPNKRRRLLLKSPNKRKRNQRRNSSIMKKKCNCKLLMKKVMKKMRNKQVINQTMNKINKIMSKQIEEAMKKLIK